MRGFVHTMVKASRQPTYRLRRVPSYVGRAGLASFIAQAVEGLGGAQNIHVYSLAPSVGDWARPPSQTATLTFNESPIRLCDGRSEWAFPVQGQGPSLLLDTHFLDFTPLNDINPDLHQFEWVAIYHIRLRTSLTSFCTSCLAISGLASHPFGSWRKRDAVHEAHSPQSTFMWLRDQLPVDVDCLRVITYGYDTTLVNSKSFQTIDDIALFFIQRLLFIRPPGLSAKPLILLAHSLGGIILKSALLFLAASGESEGSILKDIRLIIFFGVPNKGMQMSHLIPMVKSQPNRTLVECLSPSSEYLTDVDRRFSGIALYPDIRLISAYETAESLTATVRDLCCLRVC